MDRPTTIGDALLPFGMMAGIGVVIASFGVNSYFQAKAYAELNCVIDTNKDTQNETHTPQA